MTPQTATSGSSADFDPAFSAHRSARLGAFCAGILLITIVAAATVIKIGGAVVTQGLLVVDSNVKKIQHPTGGVVSQLLVRDGTRVKAGDILVRLDDTQTRANLGIITKQLDELDAKQAREEAERDNLDAIEYPKDLEQRRDDADIAHILTGETRLFGIREAARAGQKSQLQDEIAGLEVQQDARVSQIEWIKKELEGVNSLWKQNLVPYTRVTSLEREASRLEGERGQLISSIAQTKGKITQVDQDMRAETGKDLGEIRGKISELLERKVAAEDQLKRVEIKAPQDGVVHQSNVHTVGGVINAGEPIMMVVPESDVLTVELKIEPKDIDQVHVGQAAALKFSAFNQRTTPEVDGAVSMVSADVTQDQKTNATFYTARVAVSEDELAKLGPLKLVAGMPVEAFVKTGDRSIASYLVRPMSDQIARAFREK
jgi:HlyD family secretion protein